MRICNALPIIVPTLFSAEELDDVLSLVDGVILTGDQSNVAPDLYGVCDPAGRFGPFDPRRDTAALYLAKEAMRREIPFFGICRGMQEINVAFGGTLMAGLNEGTNFLNHTGMTQSQDPDQIYGLSPL